jgi:predicted AlkP superfamily pyrophosphatase or phosphodiesterase
MRTVIFKLIPLLGIFFSAFSQSRTKKVVFIIADGIPADVIEKLNTPNLRNIANTGRYLRAYVGGERGGYTQTPTISANGYNSLLTGTWANKHNVWDNDIKAPNYNYRTIFRMLKNHDPSKKSAVFSSWTDNRTKLLGDGLEQTGRLKIDYVYDGYELDTIKFPRDSDGKYMHLIDEHVTSSAISCIQKDGPDLSWIYLEYTDDMGHRYGDSPHYYDAIRIFDNQLGRIWAAVQYRERNFKEDWLIFITTDHGRNEKTGKDHGGQSDRERSTWIVTNNKLNNYAKYYKPGIVDVMPSIANYLHIKIPVEQLREVDGSSLIGTISIANPEVTYIQGLLDVSWKALIDTGNVKISVASTDQFKKGKQDVYKVLSEVPILNEHAQVPVNDMPSSFYKVCIESANNIVNKWVIIPEEKRVTE